MPTSNMKISQPQVDVDAGCLRPSAAEVKNPEIAIIDPVHREEPADQIPQIEMACLGSAYLVFVALLAPSGRMSTA